MSKICREAVRSASFDTAAESLADLAEVDFCGHQVGRIALEVGDQLREARDQQVDDFQNRRLLPETEVVPRLAVVSIDGGRYQTRSEGQGRGIHDPAWREDKVADLVTMSTRKHAEDPHPQLPRCFTHKKAVVELVQGITSQAALADVIDPTAEDPLPLGIFEPAPDRAESPWPPKPLVRTCQATTRDSEAFGPMVAAEAQRRNFFAATSRAFLGDGGLWIWTIHRTFFPTFQPIVDFVHILTYVYLAAKAVGGGTNAIWQRYLRWAEACWQGRVAEVLDELRRTLEGMTQPVESRAEKPTDPYYVISKAIGYFEHNQPRMDYPRYRQGGLPVTSGRVESLIKQFNRRVKGTEKAWLPDHAEMILQLRAAQLSEDDRLSKHLKNRPISPFRSYKTTRRKQAG